MSTISSQSGQRHVLESETLRIGDTLYDPSNESLAVVKDFTGSSKNPAIEVFNFHTLSHEYLPTRTVNTFRVFMSLSPVKRWRNVNVINVSASERENDPVDWSFFNNRRISRS